MVKKLIISLAFATVASSSLASQDPTAPLGVDQVRGGASEAKSETASLANIKQHRVQTKHIMCGNFK